jgi:TonB-dependent starch-binding outer membrane protein SusC
MRKLLNFWGVMLLLLSNTLNAQQREVTGKVTDPTGAPISGASIGIKNSKTGTIAGFDGSFKINVPANATLTISAIGYEDKSIAVGTLTSIAVSLEVDTKSMTEVVVTGTGVATSKKKLGISVESISSDKLPPAPTASVDQALVGKIAGAQISSTNGSPGRPTNILLRGINTINRGTSPMILLDGLEVRATDLNSLDLSGIDKIEVVQGAAAATIYGAQGANGVIQLFSKKGKVGKVKIDISSNISSNKMLNEGDVHKARLHPFTTNANGEVVASSGNLIALDPAISVYRENVQVNLVDPTTTTSKAYDKNLQYYDHYKMFFETAYTTNNSITISGAKEKMDFSFAVSDNRQTSTFRDNGKYSRSNLLANLGVELAKNLKFRSITQLVYTKNTLNDATGRGIIFALNNSRPFANYDYKMPDGNYGYYFGDATGVNGYNPNYRTQYSSNLDNKIDMVQNLNLNYKPFKFLELDAKYGINYQTQDVIYDVRPQDDNASAKFWGTRWWTGNYAPTPSVGTSGSIDDFRYKTMFQNFITSATFNTDFKQDFNINIPLKTTTLLSFDYRKNVFDQYITWGADAPFYTPYTASQMVTYRIQSDYTEPFVTYGYLANQRFEYGEIFGISGGVRSDYSSAFGGGSKPFTFPRGDAYVRLSSFDFWKDSKLSNVLTEFKLRGAYGKAGIQPRPFDRYVVLNTANLGSNVAFTYPTSNPNPDLEVEVSKELEIGADMTIKGLKGDWLNSINISATYWDRSTDNAIYNVDAAPSSGTGTVRDNAFGLASNGLQASLNASILSSKDFNWSFTTNFSKQTSKITSVKGGTEIVVLSNAGSSNYVLRAGEKIGQLYGNLLLNAVDQINPATGEPYIAKTLQGNYTLASNGWVVDKASKQPFVTPNKVSFGDPNPKFNMSFINDINFKGNLSFSMQWDWVYGSHLYNQTKEWMYRDGIHGDYAKPITIDGQTGAYTAFYRGVYAQVQANGTKNYFYEDASFMRLRNLSVAYDFAKLIKSPLIQRLQIVLMARNLVTFTKYTGFDPEVSSGTSNSAFDRGVDHNTVPNLRSFQAGINVGF